MKKNILVLGAGRVGSEATRLLLDMGHEVTVIESDEKAVENIKETTATIIKGDASDMDILEQTNLEKFDDVLALTGDVETNLASCLIIERMGYDVDKTLRVASEKQKRNYQSLVENVVFPESTAASQTVQKVDENFEVLTSFGDNFTISEVFVSEGSAVSNKKIENIGLPDESLVIASEDGVCSGDTKLQTGDNYLIICERDKVEDMKMLFNG